MPTEKRTPFFVILLLFASFAIVSCDNNARLLKSLVEADSLIMNDADSAKHILTSIQEDVATANDDVKAYYNLLSVKVDDKLFIRHDDDSLIRFATDYYEKTGDTRLPEAYYFAGRTYSDMTLGDKAMFYFYKALEDSVNVSDYRRSRIFAQMGYVLLRNELPEEAKKMHELSYFYCKKINDTLAMRYCREDIHTIDSLIQVGAYDTSMMTERLLILQRISDKVKISALRRENKDLHSDKQSDGIYLFAIVTFIIVIVAFIAVVAYRRSKNNIPTQKQEPLHSNKFYDEDIASMIDSHVKTDKILKDSEWKMIEEKLLAAYPDFKEKLYSRINLSDTEYHICLLLKQDVSPSKIAKVMSLAVSSVSQSRLRMQQKAFNGEGTAKDWDRFVLSL